MKHALIERPLIEQTLSNRINLMPIEAAATPAVAKLNQVRDEIAKIIVGQQSVVDGVLICLLSGGHVLL